MIFLGPVVIFASHSVCGATSFFEKISAVVLKPFGRAGAFGAFTTGFSTVGALTVGALTVGAYTYGADIFALATFGVILTYFSGCSI